MVWELDHLLDYHDGGRLTCNQYVTELKDLVARHPSFIDGFAHLGFALLEQDKPKLALGAGLCGLALGEEAIPPDFEGKVEWSFLENRPFLRAAHGVVLCHLRLGQRLKAIPLMEKMLAWNPNDNQGIRFIIGSDYLRSGMEDKAAAIFHAEGPHYPPYRYELGLLLFRAGRHQAAGYQSPPWLCRERIHRRDPLRHSGSPAAPHLARLQLRRGGTGAGLRVTIRRSLASQPGGGDLLRWLHMHPKIMAERGAILEWREALLWEHDVERRRMILDCEETSLKRIDDPVAGHRH